MQSTPCFGIQHAKTSLLYRTCLIPSLNRPIYQAFKVPREGHQVPGCNLAEDESTADQPSQQVLADQEVYNIPAQVGVEVQ